MEKTNKYYGVIENLVKNHKKFQGLDAILDDIIDDVFAHSEVIINSINNESVIQAYLEKVVSTSIITVPKKMGFHSEIKHRVVSTQTPEVKNILQNDIQEEAQLKVENKDVVNNELVDKMINSMPTTFATDDVELDDVVQEVPNSEFENDLIIENDEQENLELEFEQNENSERDLETLDDDKQANNVAKLENFEKNDSLDNLDENLPFNNLENNDVENFENETSETLVIENATNELIEREVIKDNTPVVNEIVEAEEIEKKADEEDELISNDESLQVLDIHEEDEILESNAVDESITTEMETTADEEDDFTFSQEQAQEIAIDEVETLNTLDNVEETHEQQELQPNFEMENDYIIASEEEEFVPIDTEDDLLELSEEDLDMTPQETLELSEPALEQMAEQPLDILDNSLDDIAESITDTLENGVDEEEIKSTEGFKPMDYSIFTFTPQEKDEDVDVDDIKSSLEQLNSKHPELNILKIYELKYKNNDSVAEIATQLNMEEEQVLEALNEMIAVV